MAWKNALPGCLAGCSEAGAPHAFSGMTIQLLTSSSGVATLAPCGPQAHILALGATAQGPLPCVHSLSMLQDPGGQPHSPEETETS